MQQNNPKRAQRPMSKIGTLTRSFGAMPHMANMTHADAYTPSTTNMPPMRPAIEIMRSVPHVVW